MVQRRYPATVGSIYPPLGEARLYRHVGLWADGMHRCNLVLATVVGAKDSWAVVTDETPTLQTLWQYALRFRVEELFLDSKSGAFQLEDSRLRSTAALERLYLIAAVALLYATTQGMAVQLALLATTGRPPLAARHQLSQGRLALAARGVSQRALTAHSCSTSAERPPTCFCIQTSRT